MAEGSGRLSGKVAIVTGAGRGIGRETALLLARDGAKVLVNDLGGGPTGGGSDESVAMTVVREIRAAGGEAVAETSSVSIMERINHGGGRRWLTPRPMPMAAKEGVVGMTRTVARDLGEFGVRCNAVRPITDLSTLGTPDVLETMRYTVEELGLPLLGNIYTTKAGGPRPPSSTAAAIVWLCTDCAAPLNGREIFITGGHIALVQQPELIRSQFNVKGWDLDGLCDPQTTAALTWGERNCFMKTDSHS